MGRGPMGEPAEHPPRRHPRRGLGSGPGNDDCAGPRESGSVSGPENVVQGVAGRGCGAGWALETPGGVGCVTRTLRPEANTEQS